MQSITRRNWLSQSSALLASAALGGCATSSRLQIAQNLERPLSRLPFARIDIETAVAARVKVGLRPYRASGFVVRGERFGDKTLIHNYGHGGGGITLSWGSAALAMELLPDVSERRAAVIGCGVIGLTSARMLQERGWQVTIYAKELPPHTTSDVAGGQWAPTGVFGWDRMTDAFQTQFASALAVSFQRFSAMADEIDSGVRWRESYHLGSSAPSEISYLRDFPQYYPGVVALAPEQHPFAAEYVLRHQILMIEPAVLLPTLMRELREAGGTIVSRAFDGVAALAELTEPLLVNCTGLGAAALFDDAELTPIRGQLVILPPDPRIDYLVGGGGRGLLYLFPRADGIVLGGSYERGATDLTPTAEITERLLKEHGRIAAEMRV